MKLLFNVGDILVFTKPFTDRYLIRYNKELANTRLRVIESNNDFIVVSAINVDFISGPLYNYDIFLELEKSEKSELII